MTKWNITRILAHGLVIALITAVPVSAMLLLTADGSQSEAVYSKKCGKCHGPDAKGGTKMGKMTKTPDLTVKANWKHGASQADIEKVIRTGGGKMPKYEGKMSDQDISAAAAHTRKLCGLDLE